MPSHQVLFNDPLEGSDHPDFDQVALVVVKADIAAPAFMLDRELGHEPEQLDMAVRYLHPPGQCLVLPRLGAEGGDRTIVTPQSVG